MESPSTPYRVLTISGGGMRGLYAATYLATLAERFSARRQVGDLDIGKGFDLIAGTSTGAILACALARGTPLTAVASLYRDSGPSIFARKVPQSLSVDLAWQFCSRPKIIRQGATALQHALQGVFSNTTIADIWTNRRIALAVPAVDIASHSAWVFKTPHVPGNFHRDDDYSLVDVCLASTAAPIYRSLAELPNPDNHGARIFADGGLWANNPVLVGLVDAVQCSRKRPIEIFSLGTSPPPHGDNTSTLPLDGGFKDWEFGAKALTLSLDAQDRVYADMCRLLSSHLKTCCAVTQFPHRPVPASMVRSFDLDSTSEDACDDLVTHAERDVDATLSQCADEKDCDGKRIASLFDSMPPVSNGPETNGSAT